jgi:L-seryl-tRNA(Ser) seleniumtransferase
LEPGSAIGRTELLDALWAADPRIAVGQVEPDAIALNPQTLEPGEDQIVLDALRRLLKLRES